MNSISSTKLDNLYNAIIIGAQQYLNSSVSTADQINLMLDRSTNQQESIKLMKKLYKGRKKMI